MCMVVRKHSAYTREHVYTGPAQLLTIVLCCIDLDLYAMTIEHCNLYDLYMCFRFITYFSAEFRVSRFEIECPVRSAVVCLGRGGGAVRCRTSR